VLFELLSMVAPGKSWGKRYERGKEDLMAAAEWRE
jgi:hypothetical protein